MRLIESIVLASLAAAAGAQLTSQEFAEEILEVTHEIQKVNYIAERLNRESEYNEKETLLNGLEKVASYTRAGAREIQRTDHSVKIRQTMEADLPQCEDAEDVDKCHEDIITHTSPPAAALKIRQTSYTLSDEEQGYICKTFGGYTAIQRDLLETMVEKRSIMDVSQQRDEALKWLRDMRRASNAFTAVVVAHLTTCSEGAGKKKEELARSFKLAVEAYDSP
ncbi:hypothetical protein CBER1_11372 [Cercospora berteroae]|uniref:Fungal N-terminal domain-containing protein n=1 Tax=Cercospora berteroae TaxID=357750 RepID=A0A2S6CKV0_9PEZI|nr:hypothetical protein CBER1_11372 [Cercospora berteroae]